MLHFTRFEPAPELRLHVQGYWTVEAGSEAEYLPLIPDGFPELAVPLAGELFWNTDSGKVTPVRAPVLIGQLEGRSGLMFAPGAHFFFVKLYPWTPFYLFSTPARQFNNSVLELAGVTRNQQIRHWAFEVVNAGIAQKATSLSDQLFLRSLQSLPEINAFLQQAIQVIYHQHGTVDVAHLRQGIHASRRYVEKLFRRSIGLSPKRYARLIRVKKASLLLQTSTPEGLVGQTADMLGYFDRSHFLKDFKSVTGQSPTEFLQHQTNFRMDGLQAYLRQWDYS